MPKATRQPMELLAGRELAAVTFVRDYVQLGFDGPTLTALTRITVTTVNGSAVSGNESFRDRICDQIGRSVTHLDVRPDDALVLSLDSGSTLSFSLRPEHYSGPEAVVLHGMDGETVVF